MKAAVRPPVRCSAVGSYPSGLNDGSRPGADIRESVARSPFSLEILQPSPSTDGAQPRVRHLGLALTADFRIAADDAKFSANFSRLCYYPGFGLTVTLPRLVGLQQASLMLCTGRRVAAADAVRMGLAESLVPRSELEDSSLAFASEIAESAPLSVVAIRRRMREGLADAVEAAIALESAEQARARRATLLKAPGHRLSGEIHNSLVTDSQPHPAN